MFNPFLNVDDYISSIMQSLPNYIYDYAKQRGAKYYNFILGLFTQVYNFMIYAQVVINSLSINTSAPDPNNVLLDRFIAAYGINKLGLFQLNTPQQKADAIALFFRLKTAVTKQDIIDVFAAIGYNIQIYYYTDYNSQYGIAKYNVAKYGSMTSYAARFTLWISVSPIGYTTPINSSYGNAKYGIGQYSAIPNLFAIESLIKRLFPCYYQIIFLDN